MSNNKLGKVFIFYLLLTFASPAKSKKHMNIASVRKDASGTSIKFSDNSRSPHKVVRGQTVSTATYITRYIRDVMDEDELGIIYSIFFGKPMSMERYSEPGIGDGVFYHDVSAAKKVSLTGMFIGMLPTAVEMISTFMRFPKLKTVLIRSMNVANVPNHLILKSVKGLESLRYTTIVLGYIITIAGGINYLHKKRTEADWGIDIQPNGSTFFGYFRVDDRKLEGEGVALWPNGIGYEGAFENGRVKNSPNGRLILFPEEDKYTVEFPGEKNKKYTLPDTYYSSGVSYNSVNKLLKFADGDVFRGVLGKNAEGIYIPKNGTAVRDTLRNVLRRKKMGEEGKMAFGTEYEASIGENTVHQLDPILKAIEESRKSTLVEKIYSSEILAIPQPHFCGVQEKYEYCIGGTVW
ncbi:MAG: hypothetical protein LBI29_01240 [Rickettsiales bacterium]|jgi:hypothetical protein|nr:hypothetical protein [Rickettsiales bacterium]